MHRLVWPRHDGDKACPVGLQKKPNSLANVNTNIGNGYRCTEHDWLQATKTIGKSMGEPIRKRITVLYTEIPLIVQSKAFFTSRDREH